MRKIKRFCLNALCVMLLVTAVTTVASAVRYHYYNGGVADPVISVDNRVGETYYTQAVASWNATATDVSITTSSSADSYVVDGEYDDTWYGLYTPKDRDFLTLHAGYFIIKLNNATLPNTTNFKRSVLAHEFGHAFCLDDNPSDTTTPNASIMNYSRNHATIYGPTSDDVAGVNYAYR